MLQGKKILLGITGGIAAYKIPLLIRMLKKEGAEVKVVATPDALDFVTPLTLSVLSQNPVAVAPFNTDDGTWNSHVEMALWADLMIIAPATANTMAKMAAGIADNLLLTTWLASRCPVFFAPAMDLDMFNHPNTRSNIQRLMQLGNIQIEPGSGELASGLCGEGRMEEPEKMVEIISQYLRRCCDFSGKKVLISAGPTREPIDPVRYISNYSTGRMGYAIAAAFAERGAEVRLVSGPVEMIVNHPSVQVLPVATAAEMFDACVSLWADSDIAVMTAAVADFTPESTESEKIAKGDAHEMQLKLVKTADILKSLGETKAPNQYLVGFALETQNEMANARAKCQNKNADLIVLNSLRDAGAGFGTITNKVTLVPASGDTVSFPLMAKKEVAEKLLDFLKLQLNE